MKRLALIFLLGCHSNEAAAPQQATPLPMVDATTTVDAGGDAGADAGSFVLRDASVGPRPSPFAPLADILSSPDRVDAYSLSTRDFADEPPGTRNRIAGYPTVAKLRGPPPSFVHAFAEIVLADGYRRDAIQCSLAHKSIGFRFVRGADVADVSVLAVCPSVHAKSTLMTSFVGAQLEPELADRLAALVKATYPPYD